MDIFCLFKEVSFYFYFTKNKVEFWQVSGSIYEDVQLVFSFLFYSKKALYYLIS